MTNQPINRSVNQIHFTLQLADTALINGHRLSEWCGHGPVLEQDIAISNIALDYLGQARSLYQYAARLINALEKQEKLKLFASPALMQKIERDELLDEDDLAYLRDGWDYKNVLLVEQPNQDWAYTIARSFFLDAFNFLFFTALQGSSEESLAAIAEKSLKETAYHFRWSSEWIIRLGDGTEESHRRMQKAIDDRWMFTGELFEMSDAEKTLLDEGISIELSKILPSWKEKVSEIFSEATLEMPEQTWMQEGGKQGMHTEHLGYILAELQFIQRAYPDMKW